MSWDCHIEKGQNGYVVSFKTDEDHDSKVVFEIDESKDESEAELDAVQGLFYWLMEHFAVPNSKHNKKRMYIEVEEQFGPWETEA